MIISKTPLRMSFVGGGSDLASFYRLAEGAVVTTTIDKYIYVMVNKKFDHHIRLSYAKTENVETVDQIEHPIVKAALKKLSIPGGVEIASIADIPSKGTGLGSSSAFTVGLLNALYAYNQRSVSPEILAREACEIEIDTLSEPIGKQDQYGAAFGGLKFIRFLADGQVTVEPIICQQETRQNLERNILLLYTGLSRPAASVLHSQKSNLESNKKAFSTMEKMVRLAHDLRNDLQHNKLDSVGEILHANWLYKKEMAPQVSSSVIDQWYETGRRQGAVGGKILGAGGGGFLMFYAPFERHTAIAAALSQLKPLNFSFENQGTQIIFIH